MALTAQDNAFLFSGTITANQTPLGAPFHNHQFRGAILSAHVTAVSGGNTTITFALQSRDGNGNFVTVPGAITAAIATTGDYAVHVGPNIPAIPNQSAPAYIGNFLQVVATVAGAGPSFTVQVGVTLVE